MYKPIIWFYITYDFLKRYLLDKVKHMDNIDVIGEIESHLYNVRNYSSLLWHFS